jgi:hypothetical protein
MSLIMTNGFSVFLLVSYCRSISFLSRFLNFGFHDSHVSVCRDKIYLLTFLFPKYLLVEVYRTNCSNLNLRLVY